MPQQPSSHPLLISLLFLAALATMGGALYLVFFASAAPFGGGSNYRTYTPGESTGILEAARSGDFGTAVANSLAVQNDENKSADAKALALFGVIGAQYRATGDPEARLADTRAIKAVILDTSVSVWIRVIMINMLAGQYSNSGRDPAILEEIFTGEPFAQYLVPGDPERSIKNLFEWSYGVSPSSLAAIGIARWYTEQPANESAEYPAQAEGYLKKADEATVQEAQLDPEYANSTRYLEYRYWRTIVISRLAAQIGEPYASQYQKEYEDFFTFALSQQNVLAREYVQYARFIYAGQLLRRDSDTKGAQAQLDILVQELGATADLSTNAFVRFLKNEFAYRPEGLSWRTAEQLSAISPSFKETIENVIGAKL